MQTAKFSLILAGFNADCKSPDIGIVKKGELARFITREMIVKILARVLCHRINGGGLVVVVLKFNAA